jgi:hypothetical protein
VKKFHLYPSSHFYRLSTVRLDVEFSFVTTSIIIKPYIFFLKWQNHDTQGPNRTQNRPQTTRPGPTMLELNFIPIRVKLGQLRNGRDRPVEIAMNSNLAGGPKDVPQAYFLKYCFLLA